MHVVWVVINNNLSVTVQMDFQYKILDLVD